MSNWLLMRPSFGLNALTEVTEVPAEGLELRLGVRECFLDVCTELVAIGLACAELLVAEALLSRVRIRLLNEPCDDPVGRRGPRS